VTPEYIFPHFLSDSPLDLLRSTRVRGDVAHLTAWVTGSRLWTEHPQKYAHICIVRGMRVFLKTFEMSFLLLSLMTRPLFVFYAWRLAGDDQLIEPCVSRTFGGAKPLLFLNSSFHATFTCRRPPRFFRRKKRKTCSMGRSNLALATRGRLTPSHKPENNIKIRRANFLPSLIMSLNRKLHSEYLTCSA
jgi:hypothetical protein